MERYVGRVSQEADREKNKFETEETETDDNLSDRVTQINNETRLKASLKEKQSSGSQALIPSSQALIPSSTSTTETLTPAILTALLTESLYVLGASAHRTEGTGWESVKG